MNVSPEETRPDANGNRSWLAVGLAALLVTAALVWYARTEAFAWDEGYHLIAAFLIAHGKQPYIDFLFPQTPLNAYWNALWLHLLGEDWRVPHTLAALLTAGAVTLTAVHVYRRLPLSQSWRVSAAIVTAVAVGFNAVVFEFGSLQAYGMCLFLIVAAYIVTVSSVDRATSWRPALAGLLAGAAADSSLLTAPVAPVLLLWMLVVNRSGSRAKKFVAFIAGVVIAFAPLIRLLIKAPHPVIFGFLQYQLLFRKVEWDDALIHNLGEVLALGDSSQAVLLLLLAGLGLFLIRKNAWSQALKSELRLSAWLALALTVHLLTARPTFTRYFLFTVPFLAIIAAAGLYEVTERLSQRARPWLAALMIGGILTYGLAASLFGQRDDFMWRDAEDAAAKVREVTPATASLLADEHIYFLLHRAPPSGMELEDSHKLPFSEGEARVLHVVPRPKLDQMVKTGAFATVEMCDQDEIERLDLSSLYSKNTTAGSCQIFWQWINPQ